VKKHVPLVRLLTVAAADDLIFTMEEFNHLEACSECFTSWTEFIGVREHRNWFAKTVVGGFAMSIFETIGLTWIILTASLATVAIFYLAYVGLKFLLKKEKDSDVPAEVKEMFKVTR
jgi:hypothetical protein